MTVRGRRSLFWLAGTIAVAVAVLVTYLFLSTGTAKAKEFATLHLLTGTVEVQSGNAPFDAAADDQSLHEGAEIEYFDGSLTRLDFDTTFRLTELASVPDHPGSKIIRATTTSGRTYNRIVELTDSASRVDVSTPTAVASVKGIEPPPPPS